MRRVALFQLPPRQPSDQFLKRRLTALLGTNAPNANEEDRMPLARVPDISVIVTAHHEGRLAHRTMRSVWNAVRAAAQHSIVCEVIAVLDRADNATSDYFRAYQPDARVFHVDFGDTGPARNYGVQQAAGCYVNFLDGDDLFCRDWLHRAWRAAAESKTPQIWHPLYTIVFDHEPALVRHLSTDDANHRFEDNLEYCFWFSAPLSPREFYLEQPFQSCARGSGFGSEDWHWYCEMLGKGIAISTVDQTCFYYRRRPGTRSFEHVGAAAIMRPSRLFDWSRLRDKVSTAPTAHGAMPAELASVPSHAPPADNSPSPSTEDTPPQIGWRRRLLRAGVSAILLNPTRALVQRCVPWRVRHGLRIMTSDVAEPVNEPANAPEPAPALPPLPDWLIDEWKTAHVIEPMLFPEQKTIDSMQRIFHDELPPSPLGRAYADLCGRIPDPISHVILAPWLVRGGSDLETIQYARALADGALADGIAVITTELVDSPWAHRVPPCACFLELGKLYGHLTERQLQLLLVRFLLQKKPQVVHVMNSYLGHNILIRYGAALASCSRLYTHVFCDAQSDAGQWHGYNRLYTPRSFDHLTGVLSDNQTELDRLVEIFALDPTKLHTHYQPVELRPQKRTYDKHRPQQCLEVLWAGRMDFQKRPDLLAAIAKRCEAYPIRFHLFGVPLLDAGQCRAPQAPNIVLCGPFDGFQSLPTALFDVFLYTSQYDGLPNVLLEAMAVGLPVIASNVGGVGELVRSGETGFLMTPFEDIDRYVEALLDIASNRVDVAPLVANAYDLLRRRHSWSAFVDRVRSTPGYALLSSRQSDARRPHAA
jgi:glycosyltransferase involved in cell wall biosynthesis